MRVMFEKISLLRRKRFQFQANGVPDSDLAEVMKVATHLELSNGAFVQLEMAAKHSGELTDAHGMAKSNRILIGDSRGECAQRTQILTLRRFSHVFNGSAEAADLARGLDVCPGGEVTAGHLLGGRHEAVNRACYGTRDIEADGEDRQHRDAEEYRHFPASGILSLDDEISGQRHGIGADARPLDEKRRVENVVVTSPDRPLFAVGAASVESGGRLRRWAQVSFFGARFAWLNEACRARSLLITEDGHVRERLSLHFRDQLLKRCTDEHDADNATPGLGDPRRAKDRAAAGLHNGLPFAASG